MKESRIRENIIISWLDSIKDNAKSIYLLGDVFDFWFEYKRVVPKGFVRILGKFAELTDSGTNIHIIVGNHDLWMKDYLYKECNIKIHHKPIEINENNKTLFIGHGDGLGPGEKSYKFMKKIFTNKTCQWLYSSLHPNIGLKLAHFFSKKLKEESPEYLGTDKEYLEKFCKTHYQNNPEINFYIFGHRHLPLDIKISDNCRYINTGDWMNYFSYAVFENENIELQYVNQK